MRITEEVKQQFVKSSRAKTERINLPSVCIIKTAQCDILVQFYLKKTVNDVKYSASSESVAPTKVFITNRTDTTKVGFSYVGCSLYGTYYFVNSWYNHYTP